MRRCFMFLLVALIVESKKHLPSFVEPCNRNDPKLGECLARNIKNLQPRLAKGIPELYIPEFDPLLIEKAELEPDSHIKVSMRNIKLYHVDNFTLVDLKYDMKKMHLDLNLEWDSLGIDTDMTMKGKILILQFDSDGHGVGNITNIKASGSLDLDRVHRKGVEYLTIKKIDLKIIIGKYVAVFDGLFGDNIELRERSNQILNDNYKLLIEEFTPVIEEIVKTVVYERHENLFKRIPLDVLLPDK
ncbi:unnamed protein product [Diabrotica balteata]|uniref:Uncharacterized protein n=1 Tax=Diabrotica balteata TaxID=107213 RepID=A0A9N9SVR2_DIABA|nr:unnamed protein product [Diabrotica balteata]